MGTLQRLRINLVRQVVNFKDVIDWDWYGL